MRYLPPLDDAVASALWKALNESTSTPPVAVAPPPTWPPPATPPPVIAPPVAGTPHTTYLGRVDEVVPAGTAGTVVTPINHVLSLPVAGEGIWSYSIRVAKQCHPELPGADAVQLAIDSATGTSQGGPQGFLLSNDPNRDYPILADWNNNRGTLANPGYLTYFITDLAEKQAALDREKQAEEQWDWKRAHGKI